MFTTYIGIRKHIPYFILHTATIFGVSQIRQINVNNDPGVEEKLYGVVDE